MIINAVKTLFVVLFLTQTAITLAEDKSLQGSELGKKGEIRIAVMGDSLSAAYYIPLESGWVSLLQTRLQQRYPEHNIVVRNASISGATTAAGLQTLPVVLQEFQPHIVILEMGGNDGLQGKTIAQIKQNLQRMVELSRQHEAEVLLIGMRLPPNLGRRYTEPFFQSYAELAEQYQLAYVPFLLEKVAGDSGLMQSDGIHPKAEGQPQMLDNVWPTLETLLKKFLS